MAKKMGRPLGSGAGLTERFEIRVSPDEKSLLQAAADGGLSEWARATLVKAAKRRMKQNGPAGNRTRSRRL